jgi:hypothetical protein
MSVDKTPNGASAVFTKWSLVVGAILGGPLVAGYFFANNFRVLGDTKATKWSLPIAVVSTIVLILLSFVFSVPSGAMGGACMGGTIGVFEYCQKERITAYVEAGGTTHGWGRILGFSLVGALITFLPLFLGGLLFGNDTIEVATYGVAVENNILYDDSNLDRKEVDGVAVVLEELLFFDEAVPKSLYLEKDGMKYTFSIFVQEAIIEDEQTIQLFEDFQIELSSAFPKYEVKIHLVTDNPKDILKVI